MPKIKRTHLTETTFNKAKKLCDIGLTNSQLIQITGFSLPTVSRVKKASSFSDYLARRKAEYEVQRANGSLPPTSAQKETPVAQTTDIEGIVKDLFTIVQEQAEIIKRMDQSLTWLAEHAVIQSVNTKRRFF